MSRAGKTNQSSAAASSVALVGAAVATLASFLVAYLISRAEKEFAGAFFVSTAVATIAGNSLSLGTMTTLVYFMPQALEGEQPDPRGLIVQALRPVVVCSALAAVAIFVAAPWFADLVSDSAVDDITTMVRWFTPAIPAWAITAGLLGASRGLGSMNPTVLVNQVIRPGGQLVLIGALFIDGDPAAWQVGAAWMVPVVVAMFAAAVAVVRLGGAEGTDTSPIPSNEFWAYARPRAASTSLQIALERVDVIFVSALVGSDASGVYGALTRYIAAGNLLIYAVAQSSAFSLRRAIASTEFGKAGQILKQTTSWLVLVAWPYFLVVAFKPEPLANLLNSSYVSDAGILPILAFGMMFSAAAGPIDATLLMLGRSRQGLLGIVVAITTDIALLFLLAPRFGLTGAAVAWSLSVVAQNGLVSFLVHRISGLTVVARSWFLAMAIAVAAVVPISLVTQDRFGDLFIVGAVAAIVLSAGIWKWRDDFGLDEALTRSRRAA